MSEMTQGSYYFDWTADPPHTDHPDYAGKLRKGYHNQVYCNGKNMGAVKRFQTGPNGWVERDKLNANNLPYVECVDKSTGMVVDPPPMYAVREQQGEVWVDLYEERFATEVIYGNVVYVCKDTRDSRAMENTQ